MKCKTCQEPYHDTCPMEEGCSCCENTKESMEDYEGYDAENFDIINIEYMENGEETFDYPEEMLVSVETRKDDSIDHTKDSIRAKIKSYIRRNFGNDVEVVDFLAFPVGSDIQLGQLSFEFDAETFEAREKKIGSIRIVKNPNFPSGTSLQAYIKTNRAELRKVFGNPNMGESGDGKSKGNQWNLVVGNHRVTIYDRREKDKKGTKYFNIGGSGKYGALLVAQALSIHRNERVYAKEIVPQWLEDERQYQQVKSIDEHPDLTYERAKEYEDNRRRYGAESDGFGEYTLPFVGGQRERLEDKIASQLVSIQRVALNKGNDDFLHDIFKEGLSGKPLRKMTDEELLRKNKEVEMDIDSIYGAETFDVEFNEWAEQEMMSHGKDISFKDWAEDEGMKHGNVPITEWAEHEEESHDARYGAESEKLTPYDFNTTASRRFGEQGGKVWTHADNWIVKPNNEDNLWLYDKITKWCNYWEKGYDFVVKSVNGKIVGVIPSNQMLNSFKANLREFRVGNKFVRERPYVKITIENEELNIHSVANIETYGGGKDTTFRFVPLTRGLSVYGAEDYQKKMYQDFLDNWDDEWEGSPPTFEEWKELVKDAEDWGGNPKGRLALALQKARENAKKPKKPLKIEKLDAETSGQWEIGEQLEEAQMNAEGKKRSGLLSDPFDELSLDSGGWKSIAIGFGAATLTLFGLTKLRK